MSLTTLTIIGNGYAHTLDIYTSGGVGTTLTTTGLITVSGPTAAVTNTIAVGNGTLNAGAGLTITAGGTASYNSTVSVGTASAAGTLAVTGSITMSGTGTATLSTLYTGSNISMAGGTIGAAGTVSMVSGSTFTTTGTSTIGGAYTFGGAFTVSSGTTSFGAYAIVVTGATSVTGTLNDSSGTGAKTFTGLITVNSGGTFDMSAYAVATTIAGGITNNSTNAFKTGTGTTTFSLSQSFSGSGAITIGGTTTVSASAVITNNNTVAVTFTGLVTGNTSCGITTGLNSDTIFNGTGSNLSTGTLTPYNGVNTIEYNYAGSQTLKANTTNNYYNLILGGSGTKTWVSGITALSGSLTMNGTTTATTMVAALAITGNINLNQTSTGSLTMAAYTLSCNNLSIVGGTLTTAGAAFTVNGTTSITGGALTLTNSTGSKTLTGLVTLNGTGTLSGASSAIIVGAGITNTAGTVNITGTVTMSTNNGALTATTAMSITALTFNTATAFTMSGAGGFTVPTLTSTSPAVVTNTSAVTVGTSLTGTGGFTNSTNATLNLNFTGTPGITTLTALATGNTVSYGYGGTQTVFSTNYYNLTLANTNAKTLQTGTTAIGGNLALTGTASTTTVVGLTISGNLSIGNGTSFTVAGYSLGVGGTTTVGAGASGSLIISSSSATPTFTGAVITSAGSTWNNSGGSAVTFQNGLTVNGSTFTAGSGVYTFNTNPQGIGGTLAISIPSVTVTGVTLTNNSTVGLTIGTALSGTGGLTQAANALLTLGGTSGITTLTASNTGNTVTFNSTTAGQTVNGISYYNLTISDTGQTATLGGTTTVANTLSVAAGTLAGTQNITVNGTASGAGAISLTGGTFLERIAVAQNFGTTSGTNNWTFYNLNFENLSTGALAVTAASGGSGNFTVSSTLTVGNASDSYGTTFNDNTNNRALAVQAVNITSKGTLQAPPSASFAASGAWTNAGTFTNDSGTVTFNGTSGPYSINSTGAAVDHFYTLTLGTSGTTTWNMASILDVDNALNISYGTLSMNGSNNVTLAGNLTIGASGQYTKGSGTFTFDGASSPDTWTDNSSGQDMGNVAINGTALTINLATAVRATSINIYASQGLSANGSNSITLSGNWTNAGTFTASTGTVTLNGAGGSTQIISGSTTFNNLTATATLARTINFDANTVSSAVTTVTGTWTCTGAAGQLITLGRNGGSGSDQWFINPTAWSVDYVAPANSKNQATNPINPTHYTDGGNNINWFITNHPPNTPTSLTQGKTSGANNIAESAWTNVNQPWFGFVVTDPDTGDTVKYRIQVDNIDSNFTHLVLDYTYGSLSANGTTFAYQVGQSGGTYAVGSASMTLADSATGYWWRVYGIDNSAAQSVSPAYFGTQATVDMEVDTTAPTGGTVSDGANTGSLTQLTATWSGFSDPTSGIAKYEYAIGTTAGGTDIQNWTNNSMSTSVTATGLNLQTSVRYYFTVRATDNATNVGTPANSSGQLVTPTLSFSIDNNTVTFSNLNAGNSWTDTKTTTVHTITNAANGYSVRAYETGLLTSIVNGALHIPNYLGTYSSPTVWSGTGFGYTSNDPDIGGVDKWTSSTKFCAFSQTAPGDIFADHEAVINGSTGQADETFTVTYKVVAPSAQQASTYQTTVIYIATANY